MIKPTIEIEYKDRGLEEILDILKRIRADHPSVKAGVLARDLRQEQEGGGLQKAVAQAKREARRGAGMSNVQLAVLHEFGSPAAHIPERSFVRSTFALMRAKYVEKVKAYLVKGIYSGKRTYLEFLGLIGLRMAADMKARFTDSSNGWPANAPSTIAAKGSSKPLIDTGALRASISHQVVPVNSQGEGE